MWVLVLDRDKVGLCRRETALLSRVILRQRPGTWRGAGLGPAESEREGPSRPKPGFSCFVGW